MAPDEVSNLVKYIMGKCPHLEFCGLMTIGSLSASQSAQERQRNPDFEVLSLSLMLMAEIERDERNAIERDTSVGAYRIEYGHER